MVETVLVTGGNGFIGSHLVKELFKHGYKIKIFDIIIGENVEYIKSLIDKKEIDFIKGSIEDINLVNLAMKGVDYVFHIATLNMNKSIECPEGCINVNIKGSYNIFKSACDHNVKRIIFSSSSSVYGDPDTLPISEDSKIKSVELYGSSKWMCERILDSLSKRYGIEYNILRYFNVYGSRQASDAYYTTIITKFVKRVLNNESPIIDGKMDQSMDFIHVSDVVNANILAMKSEIKNEIFNVGTGISTSVLELSEILKKVMDVNVSPIFKDREVMCTKRQADIKKAEELLGFKAKINVEEGLKQIVQDIKEKPELYF